MRSRTWTVPCSTSMVAWRLARRTLAVIWSMSVPVSAMTGGCWGAGAVVRQVNRPMRVLRESRGLPGKRGAGPRVRPPGCGSEGLVEPEVRRGALVALGSVIAPLVAFRGGFGVGLGLVTEQVLSNVALGRVD